MVKHKKAVMELTMGTMVTIVLVVAALILGLVLVQKIFIGATESVDIINDKVMTEINNLFQDESEGVIVGLGSDAKAKIRVGTDDFGVAIGATNIDTLVSEDHLKYMLSFGDSTGDCVDKLGEAGAKKLIRQEIGKWYAFDEDDGAFNEYAIIEFTIPKQTQTCVQKIKVTVQSDAGIPIGSKSFRIELLKKLL